LENVVADSKTPKKRIRKSTETVRERTAQAPKQKSRRVRRAAGAVGRPARALSTIGAKEYYLPLPDNRIGRFLNKRRGIIPRYFRESWGELRQVVWPSRRETWKLTLAVFIFAIVFGLIIALTDYGLDKLFKEVLLK
jgi:preprotein translocase SecE subunit